MSAPLLLVAAMASPLSLKLGWMLVLAAFVSGAGIGLFFHRENWLGGYASLRRRMLRLGHIALAALGLLNIAFATTPINAIESRFVPVAAALLGAGAILMPIVCFLTAWKVSFRHLFFLPVLALTGGVIVILLGVQS